MNNGNQLNSSDTHAMAPFVNPLTSEEEYALRKAKIEEARQKLYQMELDNELQETIRKGREAEQKLADMRASMAAEVPIAARPSSGSGSGYYPNAIYPSAEDAPLTARIEGEVRESPPNSSRPPTQVPYFYHPNHPTTIQPQEPSFQAHALQFSTQPPLQRRSLGQTQAQAPARPQSSYLPYTRGPAFAVNRLSTFIAHLRCTNLSPANSVSESPTATI
ncbi:uncharacterized protein EDB91DRAFT_519256 [Suillus paluster]|uniref:uncharacterized protein n=1 Tax=Suillus paluster TaxID=48578 RepID=UPI001B885B2E|nr:uncharacterized protein EDB91DRAFT_519256 [Suillus paluster]KAG1752480.1 hypothetical protein EDB91DRAFT_519256 [Suillus paluster]